MQVNDRIEDRDAFTWMKAPKMQYENNAISKIDTDVIVIGAGHAGTCAARAASEVRGTGVIVVEQQEREHQYILGIGEVGHINSKWQEEFQIPKVDIDEFVNDWQLRTNNRSNYRLIRKYAEKCGSCFDWFIEPLSLEERNKIYPMLEKPSYNMPQRVNGFCAYTGTAFMTVEIQNSAVKKNQELAEKNGTLFLFETRAKRLIKEGHRVIGLIAEDKQGNITKIYASKGVIIAAGDYSKNRQMCKDLLTEAADLLDNDTNWLGHGWDGSGIQMGVWAGGRIEPRSHAAMGGNYSLPGFEVIGSAAVLRVNKYGKRYSNEGFGTHVLGALAGAKQPNGMLYGIFDDNIRDELTYQTPCHAILDYCRTENIEKLNDYLERAQKSGTEGIPINKNATMPRRLYAAQSISELATYLFKEKSVQQNFVQTIERYNEICRNGKDTDFGKEKAFLHEIKKAPYYAVGQLKDSHHPIGQSFKLLVTVSGLLIDENQQVLDDDYEVIDGLYATGNSSGCRFGYQYTTSVPGQSISMAQTLGREVGEYVAQL